MTLVGHHRGGQWESFVNFVEIGLPCDMWELLSLIRRHPPHRCCQMRETPYETFVIVRVEIIAGLSKTFEAPSIELARERSIFALGKELGRHLANKELFVVDPPCPTMRLSNTDAM